MGSIVLDVLIIQVYDTIHFVKPDVVMVELCPERAAKLRAGNNKTDSSQGGLWNQMKRMLEMLGNPSAGIGASPMECLFKGFYRYGFLVVSNPSILYIIRWANARVHTYMSDACLFIFLFLCPSKANSSK